MDSRITRGLCLKLVEEATSFLHGFSHQLRNKCYCFFRPANEKKAKWQLPIVGLKKQIWFFVFKRFLFYGNSCLNRFIGYLRFYCTTLMDFYIRYCREFFLKHLNIAVTSTGHLWPSSIFASSHPEFAFGGQGRRLERKGKSSISTSKKAGIEGIKFLLLVCLFSHFYWSSKLNLLYNNIYCYTWFCLERSMQCRNIT